jgi:hypothetical protein
MRSRLEEATLANKQRISQLLIERVIVGDDTLEIRHVIPLRRPEADVVASVSPQGPSNGSEPVVNQPREAPERLRSDGVRPARLPPLGRQPVIGGPAVGTQDAADHFPHPLSW